MANIIIGLSPMDGVTDFPMRQIQAKIAKPDIMFTEFVSVSGFVRHSDRFSRPLTYSESQRPIIVQLFGADPADFAKALEKIIPLGFDGIDINMGCPDKSIVKKGSGAALIGNFKLSDKIIKTCLESNVPLSVKTRIAETAQLSESWFKFLAGFPLKTVTIHGRKFSQGLSGEVNWKEIEKGASILKTKGIAVLGNGSVKSVNEAHKKALEYHLNGILIGRAALGNPWIFKEDYLPTKEEIINTIWEHAKLAWDFYGEKAFVNVLKHFSWYSRGFAGSKDLRIALVRTRSLEEVKNILQF